MAKVGICLAWLSNNALGVAGPNLYVIRSSYTQQLPALNGRAVARRLVAGGGVGRQLYCPLRLRHKVGWRRQPLLLGTCCSGP